jgi:hypothetical protein
MITGQLSCEIHGKCVFCCTYNKIKNIWNKTVEALWQLLIQDTQDKIIYLRKQWRVTDITLSWIISFTTSILCRHTRTNTKAARLFIVRGRGYQKFCTKNWGTEKGDIICQVTGWISALYSHLPIYLFIYSFTHLLFIAYISIYTHIFIYSHKEELKNVSLLASRMMDKQIPQNSMQIFLYKLWP